MNPIIETASANVGKFENSVGFEAIKTSNSDFVSFDPSNVQTDFKYGDFTNDKASSNRISQNAWDISAQSTIVSNSFSRSKGMVATTIPPTFRIANQQATNIGLFAERIKTRFPETNPNSFTNT